MANGAGTFLRGVGQALPFVQGQINRQQDLSRQDQRDRVLDQFRQAQAQRDEQRVVIQQQQLQLTQQTQTRQTFKQFSELLKGGQFEAARLLARAGLRQAKQDPKALDELIDAAKKGTDEERETLGNVLFGVGGLSKSAKEGWLTALAMTRDSVTAQDVFQKALEAARKGQEPIQIDTGGAVSVVPKSAIPEGGVTVPKTRGPGTAGFPEVQLTEIPALKAALRDPNLQGEERQQVRDRLQVALQQLRGSARTEGALNRGKLGAATAADLDTKIGIFQGVEEQIDNLVTGPDSLLGIRGTGRRFAQKTLGTLADIAKVAPGMKPIVDKGIKVFDQLLGANELGADEQETIELLEMGLFDQTISSIQALENSIGLVLARSRQQTGRLSVELIRRSIDDVDLTDFTAATAIKNKLRTVSKEIVRNRKRAEVQLRTLQTGEALEPEVFDVPGAPKIPAGVPVFELGEGGTLKQVR